MSFQGKNRQTHTDRAHTHIDRRCMKVNNHAHGAARAQRQRARQRERESAVCLREHTRLCFCRPAKLHSLRMQPDGLQINSHSMLQIHFSGCFFFSFFLLEIGDFSKVSRCVTLQNETGLPGIRTLYSHTHGAHTHVLIIRRIAYTHFNVVYADPKSSRAYLSSWFSLLLNVEIMFLFPL